MKNKKNINIIYVLPAHKSASGGSKVIYQHSELINRLNIKNVTIAKKYLLLINIVILAGGIKKLQIFN